jgi:hypothetical protein
MLIYLPGGLDMLPGRRIAFHCAIGGQVLHGEDLRSSLILVASRSISDFS